MLMEVGGVRLASHNTSTAARSLYDRGSNKVYLKKCYDYPNYEI